ncbi:MAG TPA: TonB-dependent receptor [Steroidobacteraceae bacterium]|nr:TonB-dependent receptor [Steroidobacteraceae bacterium]
MWTHAHCYRSDFVRKRSTLALCAVACVWLAPARADDSTRARPDIFRDATFEELANLVVTSVARKEQNYFSVPAAVYVIGGDEIRRSGARNLPEALRLAAGVEVARIAPHRYAVSIRGFNREFTTKLLVLQDGRYLYSPVFAGTFWDVQDTLLDNVDRIEIVRGPGGTAWGANAVNGVINIVTKHSDATVGFVVEAGGGNEESEFGSVRYGGKFSHGAYRVYVQSNVRDAGVYANGSSAHDDWTQTRGGFRIDAALNERDSFTAHGEAYSGVAHQLVGGLPGDTDVSGEYALGRWERTFAPGENLSAQIYFDESRRAGPPGAFDRDEWAFELVGHTPIASHHDLTYGVEYRNNRNESRTLGGLTFAPPNIWLNYTSGFIDDAFRFLDNRATFSVGLKLEHNDFTGVEHLPNARLSWQQTENQTWWTAVSRGARIPSIADHSATTSVPGLLSLPNTDLPAEEVTAFEAGWRMRAQDLWSVDVTAFHNNYDDLRTRETTFIASPPTTVRMRGDKMHGRSDGAEAAFTFQPTRTWRLQANATYFNVMLIRDPDSTDVGVPDDIGVSPRWQASLRSDVRIGSNWDIHAMYRFVDELTGLQVPSYSELDLAVIWEFAPHCQLTIAGQNLLHSQHLEMPGQTGQPAGSEVQRGGYLSIRWER